MIFCEIESRQGQFAVEVAPDATVAELVAAAARTHGVHPNSGVRYAGGNLDLSDRLSDEGVGQEDKVVFVPGVAQYLSMHPADGVRRSRRLGLLGRDHGNAYVCSFWWGPEPRVRVIVIHIESKPIKQTLEIAVHMDAAFAAANNLPVFPSESEVRGIYQILKDKVPEEVPEEVPEIDRQDEILPRMGTLGRLISRDFVRADQCPGLRFYEFHYTGLASPVPEGVYE